MPLDLSHQKNAAIFGYPSWVYKAQSSKDGNFYALRRLEGVWHANPAFYVLNSKIIRFPFNEREGDSISAELETSELR